MDRPSSELATHGRYEMEICECLSAASTHLLGFKDKVTFLEIDANVGFVSLFLASSSENIRAISVEQNKIYADLFEETISDPFNKEIASRVKFHHLVIRNDNSEHNVACFKINKNDGVLNLIKFLVVLILSIGMTSLLLCTSSKH